MADLDDFFAKKDKKKKTKKGFSKANTDQLKKNLEENDRKEQQAEEKANDVNRVQRLAENAPSISNEVGFISRYLQVVPSTFFKCHIFKSNEWISIT